MLSCSPLAPAIIVQLRSELHAGVPAEQSGAQ
jgi:hypothetical protein